MAAIRIGEAARRLGLTTRTLRYYEEMGLLEPQARSQGGFRSYSDEELARLERICELKNLLGFNLVEIKQILTAEDELKSLREQYFGLSDADDAERRVGILERALELNGRMKVLVEAKSAGLLAMREQLEERARSYKKGLRRLKSPAATPAPTA